MEEWRPIEYEYYEVSNLGRVRSWIDNRRRSTPKVLSLNSAPVHRLVAKAFIPNPNNLP